MNVIITGASRGIGKAIADVFAAEGHTLFLTSRNEHGLYKAVEDLTTRHPFAIVKAKAFDLSDKMEASRFGAWVLAQIESIAPGAPEIIINNAGSFEPGNVHDEAEGILESQIASNLYSAYHLTRALLPAMMKKKSGHIFNMCSIASLKAYKNGGAYSISKFALYGFSQNLREEMKPHGIRVTAVLPGAVLTDSWGDYDNSEGRIMEASDIARLVLAATQLSPQACVEDILVRPLLGDL